MAFNSISIIGLGLIGGSLAKAIKNLSPNITISALDPTNAPDIALSEKVIDSKLTGIDEAANSDLIFVATPVNIAVDLIKKLAPLLNENQVVTDVCGIKGALHDTWLTTESKGQYIGGHPMTGKEIGGYINSDPILFENSIYILSNSAKRTDKFNSFIELIEQLGARVMMLDPYEHDRVIANVSHMPQLLAVSLVNAVTKNKDINPMDFAGGGFRDMTRIASSKLEIWESVIEFNRELIVESIDALIDELQDIKTDVINLSKDKLKNKFENSRKRRDEIPFNSKGFLNPLIDIYVFVKDQPGVISKISSTLFEQDINIKDIELLKIREGTGGTFRLSFESEKDASKARELLRSIGFSIKNN